MTFRAAALALLVSGSAPGAFACTICDEGAGGTGVNGTRSAIFDGQFASNFATALLPFAICGLFAAAIHFGVPETGPRRRAGSEGRL